MPTRFSAVALAFGCAVLFAFTSSVSGQIFFTESFDYADGDLVTVGAPNWVTHSGAAPDIQVVGGDAIVTSPGSQDNHRLTGQVMGVNDVWFYAVRFSVELGTGQQINNDYFIHFKDDSTFGFNARLALAAPTDVNRDFSLEVWASSQGDGVAAWNGDFDFGEEIIAVVRWNNGTGEATLWVNPVDINSTSITDDELPDAMRATESVALRQDSGNSSVVTIPVFSVGTDFDAVLAEVAPVSGPTDVSPDSIAVVNGNQNSGDVTALAASDNVDLSISRASNDIQSRTTFEAKGVSPTEMPTALTLTVEGSVFSRVNVTQNIEMFDYDTSSWELVDTRNAARFGDSTVVVNPAGDLSRFVEPGTGCMEVRVRFVGGAQRAAFSSNTDQVLWTVE